jgi:FMN phosphatase YigB (HAD superfamily)
MREKKAVIFDYYETLAELSTPMRERLFDGIAEGAASVGRGFSPVA